MSVREALGLLDVVARRAADARDVGIELRELLEGGNGARAVELGEIARAPCIGIEDAGDRHAVRAIGERVQKPGDSGADDEGFHTTKDGPRRGPSPLTRNDMSANASANASASVRC